MSMPSTSISPNCPNWHSPPKDKIWVFRVTTPIHIIAPCWTKWRGREKKEISVLRIFDSLISLRRETWTNSYYLQPTDPSLNLHWRIKIQVWKPGVVKEHHISRKQNKFSEAFPSNKGLFCKNFIESMLHYIVRVECKIFLSCVNVFNGLSLGKANKFSTNLTFCEVRLFLLIVEPLILAFFLNSIVINMAAQKCPAIYVNMYIQALSVTTKGFISHNLQLKTYIYFSSGIFSNI